jgi:hypothetical protein
MGKEIALLTNPHLQKFPTMPEDPGVYQAHVIPLLKEYEGPHAKDTD